jgi:pimeloyl-ACP methyl ester carboxylesterase
VIAAELEAFVEAGDLRGQLSKLKAPVLLRVGEKDVATPPELSREIADAVPGARLEIVPNCGHALLIEDVTATVESVRSFLRQVA